jgi:superfamily II DNA/RNA helicase
LAFVNDYQKSDGFAVYLRVNEIKALSLNGFVYKLKLFMLIVFSKRDQAERHETLKMFRKDEINVIVCTDVCSCGLDIKELDYVINVDLPKDFQTYVHRIGRTGRLFA